MYKGKIIFINRHALDGMNAERPPIRVNDVEETLKSPDKVNGRQYMKWIGNRTIIIYVQECPDYWDIRSVSSTRRKIK
jgi:hypothetical protein